MYLPLESLEISLDIDNTALPKSDTTLQVPDPSSSHKSYWYSLLPHKDKGMLKTDNN